MKKVALIGLGAMGTFFAGRLNDYLGDDFVVIASGSRKQRIEQNGLTINDKHYNFRVLEPETTDFVADLIIVAVKSLALDEALGQIKNFVGENTQILAVLNGVEADEKAMEVYGDDHVLYSYMRVSNELKDNQANFDELTGRVFFGEKDNTTLSLRVQAINELFDGANIKYVNDQDMVKSLWHKYMCNVGENLTCALVGVPFGGFTCSGDLNAIRIMLMKEVVAIANAKGIGLTQQDIEDQQPKYLRIPFHNQPSTLQDINNKRATEVDMFAGTVVRYGQELGVPTPINEFVYHAIKVLEQKNNGLFD